MYPMIKAPGGHFTLQEVEEVRGRNDPGRGLPAGPAQGREGVLVGPRVFWAQLPSPESFPTPAGRWKFDQEGSAPQGS